jgi:hypothetical protein
MNRRKQTLLTFSLKESRMAANNTRWQFGSWAMFIVLDDHKTL